MGQADSVVENASNNESSQMYYFGGIHHYHWPNSGNGLKRLFYGGVGTSSRRGDNAGAAKKMRLWFLKSFSLLVYGCLCTLCWPIFC
jgi:hypothetical protein